MKTCKTRDLCQYFLDAVERVVHDLRAKNLTQPTDAEGYCEMAQNCGPIGWAVFHGAAAAFREHVCEECGRDAESLVRAMHDLVNTKLGKPLHAAVDVRRWEPLMRQAARLAEIKVAVHRDAKGQPIRETCHCPCHFEMEQAHLFQTADYKEPWQMTYEEWRMGGRPGHVKGQVSSSEWEELVKNALVSGHAVPHSVLQSDKKIAQFAFEESAYFKSQFRGSHAIDENGRPVLMYSGGVTPLSAWDMSADKPVFLSNDRKVALGFADMVEFNKRTKGAKGATAYVLETYAMIQNPLILTPRGYSRTRDESHHEQIVIRGETWFYSPYEANLDGSYGWDWGKKLERQEGAAKGHDGIILRGLVERGFASDVYIVRRARQLIPLHSGGPMQARLEQGPPVTADCTEMRLPLEAVEVHPEKYQYRRGGIQPAAGGGLDADHVMDIFSNFDPNRFEPVVVRRTEDGRYELLSGHHRLAAFVLANERGGFRTAPDYDYQNIPALVRTVSLETAQQLARLSNASIKEYKPSELARVFRIEAEAGLTPEQIGSMYGSRRPGEVQQYLDISLLPLDLQELLDVAEVRKSFSVAHAAVLGRAMRVYQIGPNTVRQIFDRVLKEREYTAAQLEKLIATFGPQLREIQGELFPGAEFTGALSGILGLIRQAMDGIRDLSRKRRLLNCIKRLVAEKEEAGDRVSAELRRSQEEAGEEIKGLDQEIEGIRDRLGIAIRKQPAAPEAERESQPEPVVIPREQLAMVADPRSRPEELRQIADGLERRSGAFKNNPALEGTAPFLKLGESVTGNGVAESLSNCRGAQARKLERCIRSVKARGTGANPWAVCQASIGCKGDPPREMKAQGHETGWALCVTPDGRTVHGPEAHGDHDHVDIPMVCPPGSTPYGTFHTHPDGAAKPSEADRKEGCRLGLKVLCVSDGHRNGANVNCSKPRC